VFLPVDGHSWIFLNSAFAAYPLTCRVSHRRISPACAEKDAKKKAMQIDLLKLERTSNLPKYPVFEVIKNNPDKNNNYHDISGNT